MKTLKGLFLMAAATSMLVACTDEKSSTPAPVVFGMSNVNVMAVPSNAAPMYYTNQLLSALSKLGVDQPTPVAIFQPKSNSEQKTYRQARSLLSARGQAALREIDSLCDVRDSGQQQTGSVQQTTSTRNSSIEGRRCPVNVQSNTSVQATSVTNSASEQNTIMDISGNTSYQLRSAQGRGSLIVVGVSVALRGQSTHAVSGDRQKLEKDKVQMNNQMKITLSNGEVISGAYFQEALEINEKNFNRSKGIQSQAQYVADLNSAVGDIRLVYVVDDSLNPSRRAYVNGAEVNPYYLAGLFGDTEISRAR